MCFLFLPIVDVLEEVGLRDGSLVEDGASLAVGSDGSMSAFSLTRPLAATTSTIEWEIIAAKSDTTFSVYTVFDASAYTGTLLTIGNQFQVYLNTRTNFGLTSQTLTIELPGVADAVQVEIPAQAGYRSVGIRLDMERLAVVVDCNVLDIVLVGDQVTPINITDEEITVFSQPITVSNIAQYNNKC